LCRALLDIPPCWPSSSLCYSLPLAGVVLIDFQRLHGHGLFAELLLQEHQIFIASLMISWKTHHIVLVLTLHYLLVSKCATQWHKIHSIGRTLAISPVVTVLKGCSISVPKDYIATKEHNLRDFIADNLWTGGTFFVLFES
jgi:hypothetical protein